MRGLIKQERDALEVALTPADPEEDAAPSDLAAIYEWLATQGRIREVAFATDDWEGIEWRTTDLGSLALRVCPTEEA